MNGRNDMFPIALNLTKIPVLLVGRGPMLKRRKKQLAEAKAENVIFLEDRLPTDAEVQAAGIIMTCGLSREDSETVVVQAHAAGKLINVEDITDLCDYYFTANVRRGDLLIAISTSGASPTLARRVRDTIGKLFGEEWAARTNEMKDARMKWRAEGKGMKEVAEAADAYLAQKGWLP